MILQDYLLTNFIKNNLFLYMVLIWHKFCLHFINFTNNVIISYLHLFLWENGHIYHSNFIFVIQGQIDNLQRCNYMNLISLCVDYCISAMKQNRCFFPSYPYQILFIIRYFHLYSHVMSRIICAWKRYRNW